MAELCYFARMPWVGRWPAAGLWIALALSVGVALGVSGCAGAAGSGGSELATSNSPSAAPPTTASGGRTPSPTTPQRTATTPDPAVGSGVTIAVGQSDNGRSITVLAGDTVVLTLPNPSTRELAQEIVTDSNEAVLRQLKMDVALPQIGDLVNARFQAMEPGTAVLTTEGESPFTVHIVVAN